MKLSTATLTFSLESDQDPQDQPAHKTRMVWSRLDPAQVLFLEKHLIGFLAEMNAEAAGFAAPTTESN